MSERSKAVCRRISGGAWKRKLDVADEVFDPDCVAHGLRVDVPPGLEGFRMFVSTYLAAFPDMQMTIEDQIAERDKGVTRWTVRATHTGESMGIPATTRR